MFVVCVPPIRMPPGVAPLSSWGRTTGITLQPNYYKSVLPIRSRHCQTQLLLYTQSTII